MKTIIALTILASLVGCGDNMSLDEARNVVKTECGDAPLAPGYSVAFEKVNGFDRALMSPDDWNRIEAWRSDVEAYEACVQGFANDTISQ